MDDLISRQAAIDEFKPYAEYESNSTHKDWVKRIETVLRALPSVRTEIIHCRDCKYSDTDNNLGVMFCWRVSYHEASEDGFCSWAERRTDGTD